MQSKTILLVLPTYTENHACIKLHLFPCDKKIIVQFSTLFECLQCLCRKNRRANTKILARFRVYIDQMIRYNKRKMLFDTNRNFPKNYKLIWLLNFTCFPTKLKVWLLLKHVWIGEFHDTDDSYSNTQNKISINKKATIWKQKHIERFLWYKDITSKNLIVFFLPTWEHHAC